MSSDDTTSAEQAVHTALYRAATCELRPLPLVSSREQFLELPQMIHIKTLVCKALQQHAIEEPRRFDLDEDYWLYPTWRCYDDPKEEEYIVFARYVSIIFRHPPDDRALGRPTVLVSLDWDEESSKSKWPAAVSQIQSAIKAMKGPMPTLDVEFIACHLTCEPSINSILNDAELEKCWNSQLLDGITHILEESPVTKGCIDAVILSRIGLEADDWNEGINPVTVWIAMDYRSTETEWPPVVAEIKHFLRQHSPRHIEVRIEHRDWDFSGPRNNLPLKWSPFIHENRPYEDKVNLGAEIGCSDLGSGTLGCYVEVKRKGRWFSLALTNYHAVRPALENDRVLLDKVDREGITVEEATAKATSLETLRYPCKRTHQKNVATLRYQINDYRRKTVDQGSPASPALISLQKELDDKIAFVNEGRDVLGNLWAASGFARRSKRGRDLDWALIDVPAYRRGSNSLPDKAAWKKIGSCAGPAELDEHPRLRKFRPQYSLSKTKQDDVEKWKMGASTETTCGMYFPYWSYCRGVG